MSARHHDDLVILCRSEAAVREARRLVSAHSNERRNRLICAVSRVDGIPGKVLVACIFPLATRHRFLRVDLHCLRCRH